MTRNSRIALPLLGTLIAVAGIAAPVVATAQPPLIEVHGVNIGHHAVAYDRPNCRTVYTFGRRGQDKKILCDAPRGWSRHVPPRWSHHRHYRRPVASPKRYFHWQNKAPWHHHGTYVPAPAARPPGRCDTGLVAGAVGGAAGALAGSRIGKGDGQIVATAVGTLIGTLAGLGVGETLDRTCIASALEYAPDDHTVRWQPATAPAASWQVTPATTWQGEDGRYCREFTSTATVGNQPQSIYGRACRQPDGTWEIVS